MLGKIGKIVVALMLSFVFFIVAAIVLDSMAGMIFGNKSNGDADVSGGVMLVVTTLLSIAFGVWFYKFVHLHKQSKSEK